MKSTVFVQHARDPRNPAPLELDRLTKVWREKYAPAPAPTVPRWSIVLATLVVACLLAIGCADPRPVNAAIIRDIAQ